MKTPEEEIRLAREAETLMSNPVFKQAFEGIESSLIEKMRLVAMHDIDTQHELILTLQLLGGLRRQFTDVIQSGKMAQIQKEQSLGQKLRRIGRQ